LHVLPVVEREGPRMSDLTREHLGLAPTITVRETVFDLFIGVGILLAIAHFIAHGCRP